jgi:hypothetical protein
VNTDQGAFDPELLLSSFWLGDVFSATRTRELRLKSFEQTICLADDAVERPERRRSSDKQ